MSEARLIRILAFNVSHAGYGNYPLARALFDWMHQAPGAGDLVVETTTIWYESKHDIGVGRFLRTTWEDLPNWDEDEPNPGERVTYITALDGREVRWVNASFIRVPTQLLTMTERDKVKKPNVEMPLVLAERHSAPPVQS